MVEKDRFSSMELRHVGQDIMVALLAVRFMPSLRCLELIGIVHPPTALVIGHPGVDRITTLCFEGVTFDIGKSEAD